MKFKVYFNGELVETCDTRAEAETFIGIENTQMEFAEYTAEELRRLWKIVEVDG